MQVKTLADFTKQFAFNRAKTGMVGVERECHLIRDKKIVPIAQEILNGLHGSNGQFTYELSACQLEWRVGPCRIDSLEMTLKKVERQLRAAEKMMNFRRSFAEIAPEDMPLDVYPDPTGRYAEITANMSKEILSAACRVVATHIHVGMPGPEMAILSYNRAIESFDLFCQLGDHSNGERQKVYRKMAPDYRSPRYDSWEHFYKVAVQKGFANNPRDCWNMIRISRHGTIEFRMFGATNDCAEIVRWARLCKEACRDALTGEC